MCLIHKLQGALGTQRRIYSFYKKLDFNYFYNINEYVIFL
jgi:hypothetical protein